MTGPCPRPECGGEIHTDGWGNPTQCPRDEAEAFTYVASEVLHVATPVPCIVILSKDNHTPLVTIHPDGELEYGPAYTPDEAARRFWDALRHLAPARCPNCGHIGTEAP